MANLKSSKKDIRRSETRRQANQGVKSAIKTFTKKVRLASAGTDADAKTGALVTVVSAIDKAVQRGMMHKNQAARRKSRITKALNAASK